MGRWASSWAGAAAARERAGVDDALAAGWEQLRGGRWEAARATFAAAAAGSGSAEAFEGLSWAAWWRDDAHAVFAARERAYALYRRRGDPAAAARVGPGWPPTSSTSAVR